MKRFIVFCFIIIVLDFSYFSQMGFTDNHAIIINGGDPKPTCNALKNRLANILFSNLTGMGVKRNNINDSRTRQEVIDALEALKNKECKCGDNIIITFIGHSSPRGFSLYPKNAAGDIEEEWIWLDEMKNWINDALINVSCCCKVHLIISGCYSGYLARELVKCNPHIVTGISCSDIINYNHTNIWNPNIGRFGTERSWMHGVNSNLLPSTLDKYGGNWQDALQEIQYDATAYAKFKKNNPSTFKRIVGHVKQIIPPENDGGPKKVIIERRDGKEQTIELISDVELDVGNIDLDYCDLTDSSYINAVVRVRDLEYRSGHIIGNYRVMRNPNVQLNIKGVKFHVDKVEGDKITISFIEPAHWGTKVIDRFPTRRGGDVDVCQSYEINSGYMGEDLLHGVCYDTTIAAYSGYIKIYEATEITEFRGHVDRVDLDKRKWIDVLIKEPEGLRGQIKKVRSDDIPDWVEICKYIKFTGELENGIIDAKDIEEIGPIDFWFWGHVREVDTVNRTFRIHINIPKSMWCRVMTVTDVPEIWIRELKPCDWVMLTGFLSPGEIKLDGDNIFYTYPVITIFKGHVVDRLPDNKRIIVDITSPPPAKRCTVEYKGTGSLNENIGWCDDIEIRGYMINDGYILTEENPIIVGFIIKDRDAGLYRWVLPKSQELPFTPIPPTVGVKNNGDSSISNFQVSCWVDSAGTEIYRDSKLVSTLTPGDTTNVIFNIWTTGPESSIYNVNFKTMLPDDENPANDTLSRFVTIIPDTGITNQQPELSGGDVFPDSGNYISHTPFTYTVHFFDPDGDTASICKVIIIDGTDSTHHTMTLVSGILSNGTYGKTIPYLYPPQTSYKFIFIATDERGYTVISQEYFGPIVTVY